MELKKVWSLSSVPKPFVDWKMGIRSPLLSFLVSRLKSTTSFPPLRDSFVRKLGSEGVREGDQARKERENKYKQKGWTVAGRMH